MYVQALLQDAPILGAVAARWGALRPNAPAVTRFAPSPTGELHLGHVVHALWVWGVAARLDARIIVRMEDHDQTRSRREFESSILADIEWLGFDLDVLSMTSLTHDPVSDYRQSDVPGVYAQAVEQLARAPGVYGCTCTRAMLGPADADGERSYPGTCRGAARDREGPVVWRVVIPAGEFVTHDLLLGSMHHDPAREYGDVVVRDANGQWTYQLCVVVDDMRHGVNVVVRGADLQRSTGRQAALGRLLGRSEPVVTLHHPLVHAPDGRKLSKRDESETITAMRRRGMDAGDVLRAALAVSGLLERP